MTPDGRRIFVASSGEAGMSLPVIDTATNTFSRMAVDVPTGLEPVWMVVNPSGTKLYVQSYLSEPAGPITDIDTATGAVLSRTSSFTDYDPSIVKQRGEPQFTPDGRYLFVMGGSTQITMYDTNDDSVKATIPVPTQPNPFGDRRVGFFFMPNQVTIAHCGGCAGTSASRRFVQSSNWSAYCFVCASRQSSG